MGSPKRIMIFGRPGSGKSTFAVKLSKKLGLPLYHLDKYFFTSHWVERPYDEFLEIQKNLIHQDRWIIDGNSVQSLAMRYDRADLVIYMDRCRYLCLFRLIKRCFSKNRPIDDRAPHCPEILRWRLIRYMWTFPKRVEAFLKLTEKDDRHKTFITLKNEAEIQKFFKCDSHDS